MRDKPTTDGARSAARRRPDRAGDAAPPPLQNTPEAFQTQLLEGQYNELRVALFYMLCGFHTRIGFDGKRYDITLLRPGDATTRRIEVKWDKRAADSGNAYFEVENTRQREASGVMSTTADVWAHVIGDGQRAWLAPVPALRQMLADGDFRSVHTRGADSNSRGLLLPLTAMPAVKPFAWVRLPTVEDFFGEIYRAGKSAG